MTLKISDALGLGLFSSLGLWWVVAPKSVLQFYAWFHRKPSLLEAKLPAIRVVGVFLVVLTFTIVFWQAGR
jgi:hypothetical protein